jgi:hypothetical protein
MAFKVPDLPRMAHGAWRMDEVVAQAVARTAAAAARRHAPDDRPAAVKAQFACVGAPRQVQSHPRGINLSLLVPWSHRPLRGC